MATRTLPDGTYAIFAVAGKNDLVELTPYEWDWTDGVRKCGEPYVVLLSWTRSAFSRSNWWGPSPPKPPLINNSNHSAVGALVHGHGRSFYLQLTGR